VGVADEAAKQIRKRQEESEEAKTVPIARTASQTKKKCEECPPDGGSPFLRNTAGWSAISIAYQARICGLPVGLGFITEWSFNGVMFDGFDSPQCLLKEAKAKYDQFFDRFGVPKEWWEKSAEVIFDEAMRQGAVAKPRPPVQLRWYFMEPTSYRYFSTIIRAAYPDIEVIYQP
jgi:hypothetical protein